MTTAAPAARPARPHYSDPDFTAKRVAYIAAAMLDAIGDAIANSDARFPADVHPDVLGSLEDAGMAFAGRPTNRGLAHYTEQRGTGGTPAAPAPAPVNPAPTGGAYIALPAGCSLAERATLPANTTVVLARGKYWNSEHRDTPTLTMHIAVWGLPTASFCRTDLVDTEGRESYQGRDGATNTQHSGRPDIAGRDDARFGYPADSDCEGCRRAFAEQTRESLPASVRYPMLEQRRAAREARALDLAAQRDQAAAAATLHALEADASAALQAVEPVDLGEVVERAPGRDLVASTGCGTSRAVRPVGAPAVTVDLVDPVNLHDFDVSIWNTSGGIDSTAEGVALVELAIKQDYPLERIIAVHCDLGDVEWEGAAELAEEHARALGVQFYRVSNAVDLLGQVRQRRRNLDAAAAKLRGEAEALSAAGGPSADVEALNAQADRKEAAPAWYSSQARYCTKSQKTGEVEKLMTALAKVWREAGNTRPLRILNTLGIRADESPARALKTPLGPDSATNGRRTVTRWLPIFTWNDDQVWGTVRRSGLRVHGAYLAGMSRLSCSFCVLGSRADLVTAARIRPALAAEMATLEDEVHATFLAGTSIREIAAEGAEAGPLELPEPAALADLAAPSGDVDQVDQATPAYAPGDAVAAPGYAAPIDVLAVDAEFITGAYFGGKTVTVPLEQVSPWPGPRLTPAAATALAVAAGEITDPWAPAGGPAPSAAADVTELLEVFGATRDLFGNLIAAPHNPLALGATEPPRRPASAARPAPARPELHTDALFPLPAPLEQPAPAARGPDR